VYKVNTVLNGCNVNKVWMNSWFRCCIPVICTLILVIGCKQPKLRTVSRGFYFWKSRLQLSNDESAALQQLKVTDLYVKFFDVLLNADGSGPMPVARLEVTASTLQQLKQQQISIVPVIFITNETFQQTDSAKIHLLAENSMRLLTNISQTCQLQTFNELQIDCDWTQSTKTAYFAFLELMRKQMQQSALFQQATLSATLRLHQIKYSSKTGIPPVNKGLLMCYNMGNLKNPSVNNSILDVEELQKYLGGLPGYPLPVDVALPLFEWSVLFRNNQFKGVIQNIDPTTLPASAISKKLNRYRFLKDTVINDLSFMKDDVLRYETCTKDAIAQAASFVTNKLANSNQHIRLSFYHLDPLLLTKHPTHELEALYRRFIEQ
jgi:hypothetical protein